MAQQAFIVTGDKELDATLAGMEVKLQKKVLSKATRETAKFVAADARSMAPHLTGELERSIKVRARKRSRRNKHSIGHAITGGADFAGEGLPFYGKFQELGAPGINLQPDPFLRPALYGNAQRIKAEFMNQLRAGLRLLKS